MFLGTFGFLLCLLVTGVGACGPADKSGGPGNNGDGGGGSRDGALGGSDAGSGQSGTTPVGGACEFTSECVPGAVCYSGVCVGEGSLRFSMTWNDDTDIDLHVLTPGGSEIYYADPILEGGELDVDDCVSGICTVQDAAHVENVVFEGTPASGTYEFWAHNYDGTIRASVTLDAFVNGVQQTFVETIPTAGAAEGMHHTVTF